MADRYDHFDSGGRGDEDCPYAWISEWLCEYVDGTMDPSMRAIFEEYMEANPELAEHVERLCRTRTLLSECECRQQAASGRAKARLQEVAAKGKPACEAEGNADRDDHVAEIEAQIKKALAEEEAGTDAGPKGAAAVPLPQSAGAVVAAASAMTLMLGVGLFAGAVLFADSPRERAAATRPAATEQAAPDRGPASPSRALPRRAAANAALGASDWATPPLPLKKMPTSMPDSAAGTSSPASSSSSPLLLQQTRLNP